MAYMNNGRGLTIMGNDNIKVVNMSKEKDLGEYLHDNAVQYMSPDDLKPYFRNPRKNKKTIDMVVESIKDVGFRNPIHVDKNMIIITGHSRWKASKKLGMKLVPVIVEKDMTEEQANEYRVIDNKTQEQSQWDESKLSLELQELTNIDMSRFFEELKPKEEKKKVNGVELKEMEIKPFEHYDFLMFVFKNSLDWQVACHDFGVEKVVDSYGDIKKVGVGRVIDGARLVKKLGH